MQDELLSWSIEDRTPKHVLFLWKAIRFIFLALGIASLIYLYHFLTTDFELLFWGRIDDPLLKDIIAGVLTFFFVSGILAAYFKRPFVFSDEIYPATFTITAQELIIGSLGKEQIILWGNVMGWETAAEETARKARNKDSCELVSGLVEERWGKYFNIYLKTKWPWEIRIRFRGTNENKYEIKGILGKLAPHL